MWRFFALSGLGFPILCFAETPFAGSWVVQPELTTYSGRQLSFSIERGEYKRTSCVPTPAVPTDGKEHPITGDSYVQSMSVRLLDRDRVEVVEKIGGNLTWKGTYTVANDKKSMILKYEDRRAAKAVTGTVQFAREGDVIANAHLLSGTWKPEKLLDLSATGLSMTFRDTDNGLAMTASDGRTYDAEFDRDDQPLKGYLDGASVRVFRGSLNHFQVNRKQNGVLVELSWGTFSDDKESMKLMQLDEQCQAATVWTLRKHPS